MPCDTRLKKGQSISQRADEIRKVVARLSQGLLSGAVKVKIGPQGAIAFQGLSETERDGVTDACAYRRLMSTGSALAIQAIARAEQLAGRSIDKRVVASGIHSHDGGITFHGSHKH
jgi:hypothetical protein